MLTLNNILIVAIAFAVTAAIMPLIRKLSIKIGNIDVPRVDARKLTKVAIPNGAGAAIFLGFLVATLLLGDFSSEITGLLIAGALLVVVGLIDELYDVSSKVQLLAQFVAAIIVIVAGVRIDFIGNFGSGNDGLFFLEWMSIPVTLIWIVGVTNAIRVLDGIDGLCAGVAGISAWTMGIVALMTGRTDPAVLSFVLGAVAFAYLPYNFSKNPNRKIFMAESGSSFLGFALAVVGIMGSVKTAATFSIIVPIIALIYPIFDIMFAFGRRIAAGKNPFEADGLHLHHRLLGKGLSHRQAACVFYAASIALGALAILSTKIDGQSVIYLFVGTLVVFMVLLWKFKLISFGKKKK